MNGIMGGRKGLALSLLPCCYWWFMICTTTTFAAVGISKRNLGEGGDPKPSEFCQWEKFNATCNSDEVVVMKTARYGRMQMGRCIESDVSIGCGSDMLLELDGRCSGRHHCTVGLPDPELHRQQSCPKDMVAYLEASYTCLKVSGADVNPCNPNSESDLRAQSGYLANIITETMGRGSAACPWRIRVQKGQRINLSLYDFTAAATAASGGGSVNSDASQVGPKGKFVSGGGGGETNVGGGANVQDAGAGGRYCQVYAIIKEAGNERETAVCGGTQRERVVYTSTSDAVDVTITGVSTPEQQVYFVLKYEAVGCADLKPPVNAWFSRDGDKAVVKCNFTGQTWHLVCKSTTWIGEMTNCTGSSWANGQRAGRGLLPPYGLLVAVIIGVILGVVLGLCLLGLVLGCKRRRGLIYKAQQAAARAGAPPGGRTEFYDAYDRATYKEQTCTLRRGEPGYTHVWELRSQKPPPQDMDCAASQKLSAYHDRAIHLRTAYPGLQPLHPQHQGQPGQLLQQAPKSPCKDHIYESPKFERRTLGRDPRSGEAVLTRKDVYPTTTTTTFCSTFDPNAENARNMTLRGKKCEEHADQTSDDTEDEIECDIHFPKKIGYRPVPRHQMGVDDPTCRSGLHNI